MLLLRVRGAARQHSLDGESVKPSRSAHSVPGKRLLENFRVWPNFCAAAWLSQRNAKHRGKKKKKEKTKVKYFLGLGRWLFRTKHLHSRI